MASYIRTYTGVRFVPTEPEKEKSAGGTGM